MTTLEIVLAVACFVLLHAGTFSAMLASVWKRKYDRMVNGYEELETIHKSLQDIVDHYERRERERRENQ